MKIKDLVYVLQKYAPELDIHVREDWSYYKESGISSHHEPDVTKYARKEYNTLFTEDEGDLFPLETLDDVIVDAVTVLCEQQNAECHISSRHSKEPSEKQQEIEKTVRDSVENFTFLADNTTIFASSEVPIIRATISATA